MFAEPHAANVSVAVPRATGRTLRFTRHNMGMAVGALVWNPCYSEISGNWWIDHPVISWFRVPTFLLFIPSNMRAGRLLLGWGIFFG